MCVHVLRPYTGVCAVDTNYNPESRGLGTHQAPNPPDPTLLLPPEVMVSVGAAVYRRSSGLQGVGEKDSFPPVSSPYTRLGQEGCRRVFFPGTTLG